MDIFGSNPNVYVEDFYGGDELIRYNQIEEDEDDEVLDIHEGLVARWSTPLRLGLTKFYYISATEPL